MPPQSIFNMISLCITQLAARFTNCSQTKQIIFLAMNKDKRTITTRPATWCANEQYNECKTHRNCYIFCVISCSLPLSLPWLSALALPNSINNAIQIINNSFHSFILFRFGIIVAAAAAVVDWRWCCCYITQFYVCYDYRYCYYFS